MADSCTKLRRMLLTHSTLTFGTGEVSPGRQEWVTRECGSPLFDARSKAKGVCPSCEGGWTHPHNYPACEEASR